MADFAAQKVTNFFFFCVLNNTTIALSPRTRLSGSGMVSPAGCAFLSSCYARISCMVPTATDADDGTLPGCQSVIEIVEFRTL